MISCCRRRPTRSRSRGPALKRPPCRRRSAASNVKLDLIDPATGGSQQPPPPSEPPPPSSDVIAGTASGETLHGTAAADTIQGLGGDDRLYGQDGNDRLEGGSGRDYLYGSAGDDTLLGGDGNDRLYGGIRPRCPRPVARTMTASFSTPVSVPQTSTRSLDFSTVDDTIVLENAVFTAFGARRHDVLFGVLCRRGRS